MSDENIETVKQVYAKWQKEAFVDPDDEGWELLDPEIEWDVSLRTFDPKVYHGHEGVQEFIASLREIWESGRIEPLEFIETHEQVVVPVHLYLVSRTHGVTINANAAHLWTLAEARSSGIVPFRRRPKPSKPPSCRSRPAETALTGERASTR